MTASLLEENMTPISRRTILQGLGTAIALPWLEAMTPLVSAAPGRKAPPRRMAFFYVPNGAHMADWTPKSEGALVELPAILEPLKPVKDQLMVLTGLTADKARPHGDGPGDHARAMAAFLTGKQPKKTHGADIRAGISVDQMAALKVGNRTRFASLELGCDKSMHSGNCDSGYSCAYSANVSWKSDSLPMSKEVDPKLVFERLFSSQIKGESDAARAKREQYNKSVLDFVRDDADSLRSKLGSTDQRKLDEYLTAVREIEQRVARAGKDAAGPKGITPPAGVPKELTEHIRLLGDLMVLAWQGDLTRVSTFVFANEGSNRSYKFIEVPEGHHDLSHHGRNAQKQEKIRKINKYHMEQFAYIVGKLNATREADGSTLLENSMILYGSGNSDGDAHNHDNLPILLLGKGGGAVKSGRHLRFPKDTPLCDLFVAMLNRFDVPVSSFGDSQGRLEGLS